MLASVSGWSGPSSLMSFSVSSKSGWPGPASRHPDTPGEVVHAGERVGMVGAELRFRELQRFLEERQGQVQLPGLDTPRRGCSCCERVGMVGAELRFHELQRLLEQRQGQVQLSGILIRRGEVVHAGERVGMVGAKLRFLSFSVSSRSGRARSSFPAS